MLEFKRVKQQNFYVANVGNNKILKSYNTIVGIITDDKKLYQVKYSRTTSKQVSQYYNNLVSLVEYKNYIVDTNELKEIIKAKTNLDIDTRYNCA
jgi:hypothetical protein